jgi:hypothetical protein
MSAAEFMNRNSLMINDESIAGRPVIKDAMSYFWPTLITLVTLIHWGILYFHIPVFTRIPGWFFPFTAKPWGSPWLILGMVGFSVIVLAWVAARATTGIGARLVLLIILGFTLQHGFALTEGRGIDGIRDRMVKTMHAEFPQAAVCLDNSAAVVSDYERLADSGALGICARVKPPGQLLIYMANERIANLIRPQTTREERLAWSITFASYVWPLFCYLAVVPMFFLCRLLFGQEKALVACMLYLYVPSVDLMTLHTDQAFFPLFVTACLLCASLACSRRSFSLAFLTGLLIYGLVFLSFGLLPVCFFVAVIVFLFTLEFRPLKLDVGLFCKMTAGIVLALPTADIFSRVFFNYDIFVRYSKATAYVSEWKGWTWHPKIVIGSGVMNLLEFTVWVGFPLAILCGLSFFRSVGSVFKGKPEPIAFVSVSLFICLIVATFFGKTAGEYGRYLIYMVPLVCMIAADEISTGFAGIRGPAIALILFLQAGTVYFTKVFQDFY